MDTLEQACEGILPTLYRPNQMRTWCKPERRTDDSYQVSVLLGMWASGPSYVVQFVELRHHGQRVNRHGQDCSQFSQRLLRMYAGVGFHVLSELNNTLLAYPVRGEKAPTAVIRLLDGLYVREHSLSRGTCLTLVKDPDFLWGHAWKVAL